MRSVILRSSVPVYRTDTQYKCTYVPVSAYSALLFSSVRRAMRVRMRRVAYRKRSRLRDTGMAEPWRDRTEVSYLECILGTWRTRAQQLRKSLVNCLLLNAHMRLLYCVFFTFQYCTKCSEPSAIWSSTSFRVLFQNSDLRTENADNSEF